MEKLCDHNWRKTETKNNKAKFKQIDEFEKSKTRAQPDWNSN